MREKHKLKLTTLTEIMLLYQNVHHSVDLSHFNTATHLIFIISHLKAQYVILFYENIH